ncbi:MAG: HAD family hydrolase [Candidatus Njordarchaeia archaeon]
MLQVKAVIFDLDGTLIQPIPVNWDLAREKIKEFFGKFDVDIVTRPLLKGIKRGALELERRGIMSQKIAIRNSYEILDIYEVATANMVKPVTDLDNLLGKLKNEGCKIAIVTLNGKKFVNIALDKLGIRKHFDLIVTRDDVEEPKPEPDQILCVLRKFNISGSEAVMVGDRPADIIAAKKANVHPVGVKTGEFGEKELYEAGAEYVIESIENLLNIVNCLK